MTVNSVTLEHLYFCTFLWKDPCFFVSTRLESTLRGRTFFSKLIVEIPLAIIQCGVTYAIVHPLIGLQGDIVYLTLVTALLGLVAASTAQLIGASVPTVTVALQCAPLLFLPQMMYAGLFISIAKIPSYLRWAQQLCALKYGINLVMLNEFIKIPNPFKVPSTQLSVRRTTWQSLDIKINPPRLVISILHTMSFRIPIRWFHPHFRSPRRDA